MKEIRLILKERTNKVFLFHQIEARMLLSKIVQNLNLRLVPEQDFGIYDQLVIKPKGHCANYITIRRK